MWKASKPSRGDSFEKYKQSDKETARKIYLQLLNNLSTYIIEGNIAKLKNVCKQLLDINNIENESNLRSLQNDSHNPFFGTNFIIFTIKHGQRGVLEFLFSPSDNFLTTFYEKIGKNYVNPNHVDSYGRNAFYYAVRSNDVKMVELLTDKWPEYDFGKNKSHLDKVMSESYEMLRLLNVAISPEMQMFLQSRLMSLRFVCDENNQNSTSMDDTMARYDWLIEEITRLVSDGSISRDDNSTALLHHAKGIAKAIDVLKRLLQSTYEFIPWEEIEFCLVIFVHSKVTEDNHNLIYGSILDTSKMLAHLKNFVSCLEAEKPSLRDKSWNDVQIICNLKREEVVKSIIAKYPFFKTMYRDFERCRDIRSLAIIEEYSSLSESLDVDEKSWRLITVRSLQVISSCMRNSLQNPKMSQIVRRALLSEVTKSTREVIFALENTPSYSLFLSKLAEESGATTNEEFSSLVSDIIKLQSPVQGIIAFNLLQVIRRQLNELAVTDDLDRAKVILESFRVALPNFQIRVANTLEGLMHLIAQIDQKINSRNYLVQLFIEKLKCSVLHKMFDQASKMQEKVCAVSESTLLKLAHLGLNTKEERSKLQIIKQFAVDSLKFIPENPTVQTAREIGFSALRVLDLLAVKLDRDDYYKIYSLVHRITFTVEFLLEEDVDTIEKLQDAFKMHIENFPFVVEDSYKQKKIAAYDVQSDLTQSRLFDMKNIVNSQGCSNDIMKLSVYHNENKRKILELLILDVLCLLSTEKDRLFDDKYFAEGPAPILIGKRLKEYLMRENDLDDLLIENGITSLILNAKLIISRNVLDDDTVIGSSISTKSDEIIERNRIASYMVSSQQELFRLLLKESVDTIKLSVEDGVEIAGRNVDSSSLLHYAAMSSNVDALNYVLSLWKGTTDVKNIDGRNLVHFAAIHGKAENVRIIMKKGSIPVDSPDNYGQTALHLAATSGHTDVMDVLLSYKADPSSIDMAGHTPLKHALFNKEVNASKILVKYEKPGGKNNIGDSPLLIAAEMGVSEVVERLVMVERDNTVGQIKKSGWMSPLHKAAGNDHVECAKILLAKGFDVNIMSSEGKTPLYYAVKGDREETVRFLLENGADANLCQPILQAARNGNTTIVQLLLDKNAQVNTADHKTGWTTLHWAAFGNFISLIDLLVKKKIHFNKKNFTGHTALHVCARRGNSQSCILLIENGARSNIRDRIGRSPLYYAVAAGMEETVKLMLTKQCDSREVDEGGSTPLHCCCQAGHISMVKILLENGAEIDAQDKMGRTPLSTAVLYEYVDIVQLLLTKGANVNKMVNNHTPLHFAVGTGNVEVTTILVEAGASVIPELSGGVSPMLYASYAGSVECVSLLIEKGCDVNRKYVDESPLSWGARSQNVSLVRLLINKGALVDETALFEAINSSSSEIFKLLFDNYPSEAKLSRLLLTACLFRRNEITKIIIERGADVNSNCDIDGLDKMAISPLHALAADGYYDMIHLLVENGANIHLKDFFGQNPLSVATRNNQLEAAAALLFHKSDILATDNEGRSPLSIAVAGGNEDIVKLFLNHTENLNVNRSFEENGQKVPLLHLAVMGGNIEVIKALVQKGAEINRVDILGNKAIHVAAILGFVDIVDFFLSQKMNINDLGGNCKNILHLVAKQGWKCLKVAERILAEKNVNLNQTDIQGMTPLHIAVQETSNLSIIRLLLKHGAHYDVKDLRGNIPEQMARGAALMLLQSTGRLMSGTKRGSLSEVEISLMENAVVDAKNSKNETPLLYAAWRGFDSIVSTLLENKANPNIRGKSCSTPLHYASQCSKYDIVLMLLRHGAIFQPLNEANKTPLQYATQESIKALFTLIGDTFLRIKAGDVSVLIALRRLRLRPDEMKALVNCRDISGKTLIALALSCDFPDIRSLRNVFHNDDALIKAKTLLSFGKYQEAVVSLGFELNTSRASFNNYSLMNAEAELAVAESFYHLGMLSEASDIYSALYETSKEMFGEDDKFILSIKSLMTVIMISEGHFKKAYSILEEVHEKQKVCFIPFHPELMQTQLRLVLVLVGLGKRDEALQLHSDVLHKYKIHLGSNHPQCLRLQFKEAHLLLFLGRYDESLRILDEIYGKQKKMLGAKHGDVFETTILRGIVHYFHNRAYEGVKMIEEAFMFIDQLYMETFKNNMREGAYNFLIDITCLLKIFIARGITGDDFPIEFKNPTNISTMIDQFRERVHQRHQSSSFSCRGDDTTEELGRAFNEWFNLNNIVRDNGLGGRLPSENQDRTHTKLTSSQAIQAIAKGDSQIVDRMLRDGIDFNTTDKEGRTALHYGVTSGNTQLVAKLIQSGAKVNATSKKGNTTLHTAALTGKSDMVDVIIKYVEEGEKGSFIDMRTVEKGMTALHVAASKGNVEVVKSLLRNGASHSVRNKETKTPLDMSTSPEVTSLLTRIDECFKAIGSLISSVNGLDDAEWEIIREVRNHENERLSSQFKECREVIDKTIMDEE